MTLRRTLSRVRRWFHPGEDALYVGSIGKIPVSVVIITLNESESIAACIESVSDFEEVIVVDSGSSDDTRTIAKQKGAVVVNFVWDGQLPKKKQWSLERSGAQHDWILLLDADEAPSAELTSEIRYLCDSRRIDRHDAYDARLRYVFAGRELRYGHFVTKRVLINKDRAAFPAIDDTGLPGSFEVEGHFQPQAKTSTGTLSGRLLHNDRDSVSSWFERHNRYSDWEAALRANQAVESRVNFAKSSRGRRFAGIPFKPILFFLYSFVLRLGFRDGRPGFDYAVALSFYYWQISMKSRYLAADHESAEGSHADRE